MSAFARFEDPRLEQQLGHVAPRSAQPALVLKAFDVETELAQPGIAAPEIVCCSVADERGAYVTTKLEGLRWLRRQLADPRVHLVGCNIAFDMVSACAAEPDLIDSVFAAYDAGRIHDVAIREALIDIFKGDLVERNDEEGIGIRYGMTLLARRYLGWDLKSDKKGADGWRKRYALLKDIPIEQWPWAARVYPMRDAAFPIEICRMQRGQPNLHDEANQTRAAFALALMSAWGVRTDGQAVCGLAFDCGRIDYRNTEEFKRAGIIRPNGTEDRKRLAELVTAAYAGSPPRTAPTEKFPQGQVSSDRDTLTESGDPLLENYGRAGKNDKYLTTYLPILAEGIEQPWNPQFNVLVATTRVSSNAQQFPQVFGVRECIVSRPGFVFCSVDYGGLELRTMSQRAIWEVGFSLMAEALNSGKDPHVIAAASFMGLTYETAYARYKAGDELAKAFRDLGKIWNFGKGGGMGPGAEVYNARKGQKGETTIAPDGTVYTGARFCILAKEADRCGVQKEFVKVQGKQRRVCSKCLAVAKKLDSGWLNAWGEQRALFARASKLTKESRHVVATIPKANVRRGKCGYSQYLNTPFQGLGAAAAKRAMWLVAREMYTDRTSPLWGSRLVLNVHDELIAELPESRAAEAGDRMAKIMRDTLVDYVPDLAKSVEAEPALSRNMSKKAQTVRDDSGRLRVWEPTLKAA